MLWLIDSFQERIWMLLEYEYVYIYILATEQDASLMKLILSV